ncbi:MAG TPA: type II toxin-antitoxin system Phd/YefM family antitoxin [bacterium]|nr:type II toxin-antitoxin system Phd/YefM family antitoxin [bacterium]
MKFIAMRELRNNTSQLLDRLSREDLVVTRNGKPAAALIYLDEELLEDFIIAHHPTLLREIENARQEYGRKGGISHAEMRKRIERRRG